MSLTRPIPYGLRAELSFDPFMKKCCLNPLHEGKIDWHHNFIYAGQRINEKWALLPLCQECHRMANDTSTKEHLDFIMINRMEKKDFVKFERYDWTQRKKYLETLVKKCLNCHKKFFSHRQVFDTDLCQRQYSKRQKG